MKYEERDRTYRDIILTLSEKESMDIRRALYLAAHHQGAGHPDYEKFADLRDNIVKGARAAQVKRGEVRGFAT